jgi:ABC-2 type transport system permease protein
MIATIAAKELRILFSSPLAWTILGVLQLLLAWLFLNQVDAFINVQGQLLQLANPPGVTEMVVAPLFGATAMILLVITPVLAMRLIAEERRNHTLPLLLSAPLSLGTIVAGKFLGLWSFLCLLIALAAAMALALLAGGPLDIGLLLVGLSGLVLLAACLAALGLYFSSLTAHPAVAAISGIGAALGLWLLDIAAQDIAPLHALSLLQHFGRSNRGLLDTADVGYFLLFTATFLVLTVLRLDRDRLP